MKISIEGDSTPLEITEELLEVEVLPRVLTYSTSLFGAHAREQTDPHPQYCGSGTFVSAGTRCLLTAAHVWELLREFPWFFLTLDSAAAPFARRPLALKCEYLTGRYASGRPTGGWGAWGPDMALLEVPELFAATVESHNKAFYNLDRRRPAALASEVRHEEGLWAVLGAPAEQSIFTPDTSVLKATVFGSWIIKRTMRNGFDYLDLRINRDGRPNLPHSFGGISGAGLWQVRFRRTDCGVVACDGYPSLEGVAFYEEFEPSGFKGFIRCHGRSSLYGHAIEGPVS